MAFLVCYSKTVEDHVRDKAAYLDQGFYEMLFHECSLKKNRYEVLGSMARLKYKSPTVLIDTDDLQKAMNEIDQLPTALQQHKSTLAFRSVVEEAIKRQCAVTVSGDMSREL